MKLILFIVASASALNCRLITVNRQLICNNQPQIIDALDIHHVIIINCVQNVTQIENMILQKNPFVSKIDAIECKGSNMFVLIIKLL